MFAALKRIARNLPAVLGVLLLIGAIYVVQKEFRNLKIADIRVALDALPHRDLVISFAWTILSYGILTFYDRLGTFYAGRPVSYGKVAFASFCAYALAHNLGFAAVSGAAVRYRLYAHWGLTPLQIGKVVAFCSLTFGLGGMVLGGIILFWEPEAVPFLGEHVPLWAMHAVGGLLWLLVAIYVTLSRVLGTVRLFGHEVELPSWRMSILQVLLATVDVAVTAAIFYALLPPTPGLTYLKFLGVYVASYTAGLAANLPGGIGVFDTAMLLGLSPWLEAPQIVGAIVVFRLYYYVIPLFLAGGMFAGNEILLRGRGLMAKPAALPGVQAIGRWSDPDFVAAALTGMVALCGALLLGIGAVDARPDFSWIDPDFAELASGPGEFVTSLIGAGLLVMAAAIAGRVALAWSGSVVLLLGGAVTTVVEGHPWWIQVLLLVAAVAIAPFHRTFHRPARVLAAPLQTASLVPLVTLAACLIGLAQLAPRVRGLVDHDSWWAVILSADVPNAVRALVALLVIAAAAALWGLLRPRRVVPLAWDASARAAYAVAGGATGVSADGAIRGEAGAAIVPFRRIGRMLLGLGDPAGAAADRVSAVWRLCDLARQEGLQPAFWRTGSELLKVYADLGLAAVPLDEAGQPLADAEDMPGPHASRYLVCRAERDLAALLSLLPELARPQT
jgi:uncharacterized membrane protein YbhN (UPF0104 family)